MKIYVRTESGQWINNVTYCGGKHNGCSTDIIVTIANVSMPHPGVVNHVYTDAPLEPQVPYAKNVMQGKLIAVAYALRTYKKTSSLWAEFVNKNRCISVRLVSEEDKSIKF